MNFRADIRPTTPRSPVNVLTVPRDVYERVLDENAVLLSKLTSLQEVLAGSPVTKMHTPPFTRSETVILATLHHHAGKIVNESALLRAMWGSSLVPTRPGKDSIRVHIHRIRQKGKPLGIEIETVVNYGWRLTEQGAAAWKSLSAPKECNHG